MMYTRDFGRLGIADLEGGIDERLQKPNKISAQKNLQLGILKVSASAETFANTRSPSF